MSEANKALVRRFNDEVWNKGNLAVVNEVFSSDWFWHSTPPMPTNREGLRQMAAAFRGAFSDIRTTVDDQVAEGDKVAWRWTFQAKHTGEFMGIPPTGKQITFTGISIDHIADGRFVARWDSADMLGLMQQLGAVPAPAQAG
ncbi:MAG: ester cyclase [Chloroflexi bacterium]|nr:ester cyclase [Chloroflexota bacterium]